MFMVADIHRRLIVGWLLCVVAVMLQVSLLCRGPGRAGGWLLLTVLAAADREPGHSTAASAPPATTRVTAARHGQGSLHITGTHSWYYVLLII